MPIHFDCPFETWEEAEEKYRSAEQAGSFKELIAYPCLLWRWQRKHGAPDFMRIATLSSHQLGNHLYCENVDKCEKISTFLTKYMPGQSSLLGI